MGELVSSTYANSLFEVGQEQNLTDTFLKELGFLQEVFLSNERYLSLLDSPELSKEKKHELIEEAFASKLSKFMLNFMKILCDKKRFREFFKIQEEYVRLYNEKENIIEVEAVTAIKMSDTLLEKLRVKLSNITKKNVKVNNKVDTSIFGGVILNYGNYQIDSSIQTQLDTMKAKLKDLTI